MSSRIKKQLIPPFRWIEVNKTAPTRIIIYRDGVGDGQIDYVKEVRNLYLFDENHN